MQAAIRTERDAIDFSGRDFTFHRTSRQSLNLYDLRDEVDGFADSISAITVAIGAVQSTVQVMGTAGEAQDDAMAGVRAAIAGLAQNVSLNFATVTHQLGQQASQIAAASAAGSATPCIPCESRQTSTCACMQVGVGGGGASPLKFWTDLTHRKPPPRPSSRLRQSAYTPFLLALFFFFRGGGGGGLSRVPGPARSARAVILADVEFTNSAGACVQLNRTCDEYPVVHWESARPTRSTDRRCSLKTTCNSTQYQTAAGSAFEDRVCAAVSNCTALGHCKANRGRSPVHPHP